MAEENDNQQNKNATPPLPPENSGDQKQPDDPMLPPQFRNLRPPMPPKGQRGFMGAMLIVMLLLFGMMFYNDLVNPKRKISMTQFWTYVDNNQLTGTLKIHPDSIEGKVTKVPLLKDQPAIFYVDYRYESDLNFSERLMARLSKAGSTVEVQYLPASWWTGVVSNLLFTVLLFGLLWFFLFRKIGSAGGAGFLGNFGRSRHRMMTKEQSKIKFNDVAGIDDAKDEVAEIVEFLKNPGRFSRLGGRVPRGVLLIGPPGCGKTMLAKAIAGEADVPFFSISGSDFVEMFVGVGASRVRDLFKQAKDSSPCIIFLDEIDAVGRKRGTGFAGGGHDEREQTLNAILVEMDGFESSDQIIVIAATNRADVLDEALTRPGRFDRQIHVPLPDLKGRYDILKIYAERIKTSPDVDLNRIARGTSMSSGADLAALVNEAAIAAAMANKDLVDQQDFEEARDKVRWGRSRRSQAMDEADRKLTAYHESGHALVQYLLPNADPLHKVSIIPRGAAGGATFALPERDRHYYSKNYCEAHIRVAMAGRIAEELFCGDISSGASSDILQATLIVRSMVMEWGMSDKIGFLRLAPRNDQLAFGDAMKNDYSEKTGEVLDKAIKDILDAALDDTRKMIQENREQIEKIATALLKYETLSGEEVAKLIKGESIDRPSVEELIDAEMSSPADASSEKAKA